MRQFISSNLQNVELYFMQLETLLARLHNIEKYAIIHGDGGTEPAIQSTAIIKFLPALFPHLLEGSARICLRFSG